MLKEDTMSVTYLYPSRGSVGAEHHIHRNLCGQPQSVQSICFSRHNFGFITFGNGLGNVINGRIDYAQPIFLVFLRIIIDTMSQSHQLSIGVQSEECGVHSRRGSEVRIVLLEHYRATSFASNALFYLVFNALTYYLHHDFCNKFIINFAQFSAQRYSVSLKSPKVYANIAL